MNNILTRSQHTRLLILWLPTLSRIIQKSQWTPQQPASKVTGCGIEYLKNNLHHYYWTDQLDNTTELKLIITGPDTLRNKIKMYWFWSPKINWRIFKRCYSSSKTVKVFYYKVKFVKNREKSAEKKNNFRVGPI